MRYFKQSILLFICVIAIAACKKTDKNENTFWIVPESKQHHTIVLYGTEADFYAGTNPLKTYSIAPEGNYISTDDLGDGKAYYADYYNDDASVSNWGGHKFDSDIKANIMGTYFTVTNKGTFSLRDRKSFRGVLLAGKKEQKWKAIDAYKYPYIQGNHSVWDSLRQKNISVALNVTYADVTYSVNVNGTSTNIQYPRSSFNVQKNNNQIDFLSVFYTSPEIHIFDVAVPIQGDDYIPVSTPHSKDTISVLETNAMVYIMVKE